MGRAQVEIDVARLGGNIAAIRRVLRGQTALILVVKADAYGHGIRPVAALAAQAGVRWFAVTGMDEALRVRTAAATADILILGVALPGDVPALLDRGITPTVVDLEHGRALAAAARACGRSLPVHLKIDTGMGRLGMLWPDAVDSSAALIKEPGLNIRGICSHFARVESGDEDPARIQARRFFDVADAVEAKAGRKLFRHLSNSRALLLHPEWDLDGVRAGIAAYGYGASNPDGRFMTRPVLEWKSLVVQTRRVPARFPVGYYGTYVTPAATTLAVVDLGYADGYLRTLSNRAHVLIGGRRCRLVGRISMNWITVDVGPYADVKPGDEVVLVGRQGNQEIWADELAVLCRTIPYEILVGIHSAQERILVDRGEEPHA